MKNEFVLEIEESEKLIAKGILCMINKKGEKLYVKPISHENGFIELMPLSLKELKDLNITVQESCINYDFDIEVQESTEFSNAEVEAKYQEEQRKKGLKVSLDSPESAQKAIEIATKAKEILERPSSEKAIADNVRKTISDKYIALGHTPPSLESKEDIENAIEILKSFELKDKQIIKLEGQIPTPSGSAPLNDRQIYGQMPEQSFENEKQMIDYLRQNKSPENEAILRKLFEKTVKGIFEKGSWELPFPNSKSNENDSGVKVEVNICAPKDPNQESEVEKWTKKKRRKSE